MDHLKQNMEEFQKKVEDENKMLHERIQLQVKQTQDNKEEVMQSLKVIQDMIGASMNCVGARNQRYLQISSKCTICCSPCRKDEGNSAKTPKAPLFEVRNLSAIPILEMGEGSVHFPNPHVSHHPTNTFPSPEWNSSIYSNTPSIPPPQPPPIPLLQHPCHHTNSHLFQPYHHHHQYSRLFHQHQQGGSYICNLAPLAHGTILKEDLHLMHMLPVDE